MTINIVDAICGTGKSTSLINMINEDVSNQRFLYITPYLSEVERIKNACANKHFKEPIMEYGINNSKILQNFLKKVKILFQLTHYLKNLLQKLYKQLKKKNIY